MSLAFKSFAITATETAAPLSATDLWVAHFWLQNIDAANEVFVGDSTVTSANGYQLLKTEKMELDCLVAPTNVGDRRINLKNVYAVCSAGETATLRVGYLTNPL